MSDSCILVLDAPEVGKQVPILIGEAEAHAIILAIEQKEVRRPLTHNLLNNIMNEYFIQVSQVTIDRFDEGIFYSTLVTTDGISEKRIDSRTSDAVVLALLQRCDILMNKQVIEETGMEPGALTDNLPGHGASSDTEPATIEQLEQQLRECEEREDYETAAELLELIEKLKSDNGQ